MSGNKTFFRNVGNNTITLGDVFSDVFRKHTAEENARLFVAGTALTTPDERSMLANWTKPYMFARIFIAALLILAVGMCFNSNVIIFLFTFVVGSFLVPVTVMFFFWEMNIPRNISFPSVLLIFFAGGFLSLIFTLVFVEVSASLYSVLVGFVEELTKVLAALVWVRKKDNKYILTGMLIGAAVGAGFSAIETMGYAITLTQYSYYVLFLRCVLAIGGHVLWAAVSVGALVWAKKGEELSFRHLTSKTFLQYFLVVSLLHTAWDAVPEAWFCALLCVIIVLVAFSMIKAGLRQVVAASVLYNGDSLTAALRHDGAVGGGRAQGYAQTAPVAMSAGAAIYGTKGLLQGQRYALNSQIRMGRDAGGNEIVFPAGTAGVSGTHCVVFCRRGHVYIKDRGSTYGTYINGRRITPNQEYELKPQDRFSLGSAQQEFRIG